jgi:hypothetical protein
MDRRQGYGVYFFKVHPLTQCTSQTRIGLLLPVALHRPIGSIPAKSPTGGCCEVLRAGGAFAVQCGDRYEGQWANHDRSGRGTFIGADGSHYDGEWLQNRWDGEGRFSAADGTRFEGSFKMGKRHGKGVEIR